MRDLAVSSSIDEASCSKCEDDDLDMSVKGSVGMLWTYTLAQPHSWRL
jgi:hypothetical protein